MRKFGMMMIALSMFSLAVGCSKPEDKPMTPDAAPAAGAGEGGSDVAPGVDDDLADPADG